MAKSIRISIVVIACLIGAVIGAWSLPVNDARAADPACPCSWPEQGYDGPLAEADHDQVDLPGLLYRLGRPTMVRHPQLGQQRLHHGPGVHRDRKRQRLHR